MPQWAGSCWYYLRFIDPDNSQRMLDAEAEKYWMPVDLYVGGAEHAVLHLLYARFWHKVLVVLLESQFILTKGLDKMPVCAWGSFVHCHTLPVEPVTAPLESVRPALLCG